MPSQNPQQQNNTAVEEGIRKALGRIPSGLFILTAQHEDRRLGMLTSFVQQVCLEPPMLCVSVAKGRPIMPLISESRQFGLCQLSESNKLIMRKFAGRLDPTDDPFLGFELLEGQLHNLPLLAGAMTHLECELTCHLDVEGDHDLFIGTVLGGGCSADEAQPRIHLRQDGSQY